MASDLFNRQANCAARSEARRLPNIFCANKWKIATYNANRAPPMFAECHRRPKSGQKAKLSDIATAIKAPSRSGPDVPLWRVQLNRTEVLRRISVSVRN